MIIAKVVGSAVSSVKHDALRSSKLLLVQPADEHGAASGSPFLAVDLVGAGEGELVAVTQGSSARVALGNGAGPIDAVVVGILDCLYVEGTLSFRKE